MSIHDSHPLPRNDDFVGYKRQQIKALFIKRREMRTKRITWAAIVLLVVGGWLALWMAY